MARLAAYGRVLEPAVALHDPLRSSHIAWVESHLSDATDPATVESFEQAAPPDQLYAGLERYWRKRAES